MPSAELADYDMRNYRPNVGKDAAKLLNKVLMNELWPLVSIGTQLAFEQLGSWVLRQGLVLGDRKKWVATW